MGMPKIVKGWFEAKAGYPLEDAFEHQQAHHYYSKGLELPECCKSPEKRKEVADKLNRIAHGELTLEELEEQYPDLPEWFKEHKIDIGEAIDEPVGTSITYRNGWGDPFTGVQHYVPHQHEED